VLALKAMVMTALTLLATLGVLVATFDQHALGGAVPWAREDGLDITQPVLVAVMAMALATDYGVFLLSRICELHRDGANDRHAIVHGLASTGRIITAAALLFCVAVGGLALSELALVRQLGVGLAAAVIIDASIVRGLLVPSLMTLLGRWNWWTPSVVAARPSPGPPRPPGPSS
jgi:RND superfamily putative drug exporter